MVEHDNPMGTDGFEFVEYAAPDPAALASLFATMGFAPAARHRSKDVTLWRQGGINFVVNRQAGSFAQSFARKHGPGVCAIGLRVADAGAALQRALDLGARAVEGPTGPMERHIPAIEGIGGSLIYLVDRCEEGASIWDADFHATGDTTNDASEHAGLVSIDHLTHNVHRGRMDVWAGFYERLFGFREIRHFDIEGRHTGLHSKAMVSPCGKIRIPINESADDKSQIAEYLAAYRGEGIQHIALARNDIDFAGGATEAPRQNAKALADQPGGGLTLSRNAAVERCLPLRVRFAFRRLRFQAGHARRARQRRQSVVTCRHGYQPSRDLWLVRARVDRHRGALVRWRARLRRRHP